MRDSWGIGLGGADGANKVVGNNTVAEGQLIGLFVELLPCTFRLNLFVRGEVELEMLKDEQSRLRRVAIAGNFSGDDGASRTVSIEREQQGV